MKGVRLSCIFLLLWRCPAFSQAGATLFNSEVHDIELNFYEEDYWQQLVLNKQQDDALNTSTFIPVSVVIDGNTIDSTGIQFRGYSSYTLYPTRKKPFQLSFDEYKEDQKYDGLKSLNLNNFFLDPTFCREKLCLDFLNDNHIFAPRGNYARLYINGAYWGLYLMVERVNKTFCDDRFGNNDGNLFKGDNGVSKCATLQYDSDSSSYDACYELKTNETQNDWSDLVTFIDKLNNTTDVQFHDTLDHYFDTDNFLSTWAAYNLFTDYDSYPFLYQHSYYLYHNLETDKLEWVCWDMNGVLGPDLTEDYPRMDTTHILFLPEPTDEKPLCKRMLADSAYLKSYLQKMCDLAHNAFIPSVLDSVIDAWHVLVAPDVYADTIKMYTDEEFEMNFDSAVYADKVIPGLKTFIASRSNFVNAELDSLGYNECMVFTGTGTTDIFSPHPILFPNPFHESAIIDLSGMDWKDEYIRVRVSDLSGKLLMDQKWPSHGKIDIGNGWPSGFYLVEIVGDGRSINIKAIRN